MYMYGNQPSEMAPRTHTVGWWIIWTMISPKSVPLNHAPAAHSNGQRLEFS
jgi:hypothetical protein